MRRDGRDNLTLRPVTFNLDYIKHPAGSVLAAFGDTRVLCSVSVDEKVPPFMKGENRGWVTAEYGMLPAATNIRSSREAVRGRLSGRTQEIQRLIGRSMRAVVHGEILEERTLQVDCDVIQADGGTRTAAITGSFVAMVLAVDNLLQRGCISANPLAHFLAAISVGIVDEEIMLDLDYGEDSRAGVDMNLVCTGDDRIVEIQGTAEGEPFSNEQFFQMMSVAQGGVRDLVEMQKSVLAGRVDLPALFPDLE
jgi:ribonuclease PH